MKATSASGIEAICAIHAKRLGIVEPRNVRKSPDVTQTTASVKIASPAILARLFHIRIMRFACVIAKTKNGMAIAMPSARCSRSIA